MNRAYFSFAISRVLAQLPAFSAGIVLSYSENRRKQAQCPMVLKLFRICAADFCLTQDDLEKGIGFSHEMSLKGIGTLGIDHQHGRLRSDEPGAGADRFGRQRRGAICRSVLRENLCLDEANAAAASIPRSEPRAKGSAAPVCGLMVGSQPGTGDTADLNRESLPLGTRRRMWNCWPMSIRATPT